MKEVIKKVIFLKLSSLPDSKALLWFEFQAAYNNATGESINNRMDDAIKAINELEESKYIRCDKLPNGMPRILKGIDFDVWCNIISPAQNNNMISIGSFSAENVQVGSQNTMTLNINPQDFVAALAKLTSKSPEESKSVIEELGIYIQSGASVDEATAKFVALLG